MDSFIASGPHLLSGVLTTTGPDSMRLEITGPAGWKFGDNQTWTFQKKQEWFHQREVPGSNPAKV
jgi:hypothetical protein